MPVKLRKAMQVARADISALLLIAFLFQLLTPVVVLAGDESQLTEFEEQMRASICRVDVSATDTPSSLPSHTDGFVCELCVLCNIDAHKSIDLLPEVVSQDILAGLPQPYMGVDANRLAMAERARPSAPRAPPYS
ncbi:exported hypothetical protein [Candidatus Terasakiella magnetica]|uniref:DUF2946 domain-containing protein n=1 Tax=Candidatus Terasakiella magnetica TaxID=1867952 RepID=A0A1C3RIJ1_9PROT|nr:hypothetical protein [Candidatus Terasakiella magnetica]SCA57097.1 exported hypothetical protein [Candidatus Terasakiella magnetica]